MAERMATEGMVRFVRTLLAERVVPEDAGARLAAKADASELTFADARKAIDWLKTRPFAAKAQVARREIAVPVPGVFRHNDGIFVTRFTRKNDHGKRGSYAMKLVELRDGQGDRLDGNGDEVRYELVYAGKDAIFSLRPEEQLPFEDAEVQAILLQWSRCLVCGRALRVAKSIKQGVGPVCIQAFRM